MDERDREYTKLSVIPKSIQWTTHSLWMSDAITNINDDEILFAHPGKIVGDQCGIYKYNLHKDEWKLFIQYPADIDLRDYYARTRKNEFEAVLLAFNRSANTLFLKPSMMRFFEIDMVTKEFKTYRSTWRSRCKESEHNNINPTTNWEQLLSVGDEIHSTAMSSRDLHLVWNPIEGGFDAINTQEIDKNNLDGGGWVGYLPNQDALIHFGGSLSGVSWAMPSGTDELFVCQRNQDNEWIWRPIEQTFDCWNANHQELAWVTGVVSADGNYVIISLMNDDRDKIYVADVSDLNNIKMNKCSIKASISQSGYAMFRTGNTIKTELLVSGFVRQSFEEKALKHLNMPPIHLIDIMGQFHSDEMIHWMMERTGMHCAIPLQRILSNRITCAESW